MLDNNPIAQICAIIGLIIMVVTLIATLIPAFGFEDDVENPNWVRLGFLIITIGLLRGAF